MLTINATYFPTSGASYYWYFFSYGEARGLVGRA
ncbi:MAG TPA: hypothetical protein DEF41_13780 [Desulfovibrio sp.]|jgi:hypothetical protein|uniref:Uncharacterized protein n=1 Tax=Nitratidesulfovibrio vulgaris (strain ATCC 29579 / DSM 644 / CCUG 34227 / NCIMB 8303 / VKM B-1760 / Hildenborough) TaxID=882 RepID=Q72EV9_NITV2|nr:hypothetical protein DVU_0459 [Nitratidesulfovibrio vulgaris str. Hildenborough]ADP85591.1 hypothetical protein Deval_0420 [Nitratidesulfovibrio vulgaris RCH1]HBW17156.1 hypothetical protein [Desulfovibrio sp.]